MGGSGLNRAGNGVVFNFVIGTTAEFLKIRNVVEQISGFETRILYTGQQDELRILLHEFQSPATDLFGHNFRLPKSLIGFMIWSVNCFRKIVTNLRSQSKEPDGPQPVVVIQGDTVSALVGAFAARFLSVPIVHIEAGLRSGSLSHPFPEEAIRRLLSRVSSVHFAPGEYAVRNLEKVKGTKINTLTNTGVENCFHSLEPLPPHFQVSAPYVLCSLHRYELFRNRKALLDTTDEIATLAASFTVIFVVDAFSATSLSRRGVLRNLVRPNVLIVPKMKQAEFQFLLMGCEFLITDSGGQQEESHVLGVPTLVHRRFSERPDGLSTNAVLSEWKTGEIMKFAVDYAEHRYQPLNHSGELASEIIARRLEAIFGAGPESRS